MFILLTYDIDGNTNEDKKRLRKIAKICEQYGIRVQNSVFELEIDNKEFLVLKNKLEKEMSASDSIRFYKLGKNYKNNIETIGVQNQIELKNNDAIIF